MVGIYTITSPTNKVYVGQSWDLDYRKSQYSMYACKPQTRLYRSLKKHGWEAHKFEVALELRDDISQATLDLWEEYFYDLHKANYKLLNLKLPGSYGKHSEESKKKMSETHTGKFSGDKNPMWGRKQSQETKRKISKNRIGKYNGTGDKHSMWGKHHSESTKQKISNKLKQMGYKPPIDCRNGAKNRSFLGWVIVYKNNEFIGRFEGIKPASMHTTVRVNNISKVLNGGKCSALQGYTFTREPLQK